MQLKRDVLDGWVEQLPQREIQLHARIDEVLLREQLVDLSGCLDQLVKDIRSRKRRFKTYYQFKMYNDPDTNPYMRAK